MIIIAVILFSLAFTFCVLWLFAVYERDRWMKLERRQAQYVFDLQDTIDSLNYQRERLDKLRAQPGMEAVSDVYALRMVDLQMENAKLADECNALRLEVAKYMDLYRNERYKP